MSVKGKAILPGSAAGVKRAPASALTAWQRSLHLRGVKQSEPGFQTSIGQDGLKRTEARQGFDRLSVQQTEALRLQRLTHRTRPYHERTSTGLQCTGRGSGNLVKLYGLVEV